MTVSSLAGTAGYIAPEQVLGQEADVRSDLFALGVTMFEMLSGARPFKGDSVVETLNATLMLAPADLRAARPDVPAPLSRIVMRLLEKAPESRFQSAEELVQAFEEATTAANAPARVVAVADPDRGCGGHDAHHYRGAHVADGPADDQRRVIHIDCRLPLVRQGARCERERAMAGSRDVAGTGDRDRSGICRGAPAAGVGL